MFVRAYDVCPTTPEFRPFLHGRAAGWRWRLRARYGSSWGLPMTGRGVEGRCREPWCSCLGPATSSSSSPMGRKPVRFAGFLLGQLSSPYRHRPLRPPLRRQLSSRPGRRHLSRAPRKAADFGPRLGGPFCRRVRR